MLCKVLESILRKQAITADASVLSANYLSVWNVKSVKLSGGHAGHIFANIKVVCTSYVFSF